jgi:hypothetical protein
MVVGMYFDLYKGIVPALKERLLTWPLLPHFILKCMILLDAYARISDASMEKFETTVAETGISYDSDHNQRIRSSDKPSCELHASSHELSLAFATPSRPCASGTVLNYTSAPPLQPTLPL